MPIRTVVIDSDNNSTIYLGAEIGVYKKEMDASSWEYLTKIFQIQR